jgi:hypothetical protein
MVFCNFIILSFHIQIQILIRKVLRRTLLFLYKNNDRKISRFYGFQTKK